jgi:hypothetical protein
MATWGTLTWGTGNFGAQNDIDTLVSGIGVSFNIGTITATGEINIGWGSDTWGFETWGISGQNADVTGIALSSNLGSVTTTANADTIPTGEEITGTTGTAEAFASFTIEVTGLPMTMTLSFDPEIVTPLGQELTSSLGTATLNANTIVELTTEVTPGWGASVGWSQQEWGQASVEMSMSMNEGTVDPSPDAEVTGIGFSASLAVGTVVIGEANVTVVGEGFGAALGVGNLDAVTLADVSGIAMSANIGTLSAKGFANVFPTGIGLTMTVGTNRTLVWNQVNTGTAPTWTEVDTAA